MEQPVIEMVEAACWRTFLFWCIGSGAPFVLVNFEGPSSYPKGVGSWILKLSEEMILGHL
jgi:hypothetical protein